MSGRCCDEKSRFSPHTIMNNHPSREPRFRHWSLHIRVADDIFEQCMYMVLYGASASNSTSSAPFEPYLSQTLTELTTPPPPLLVREMSRSRSV